MAVTVTSITGTPKEWDVEVKNITWGDGADLTAEVSTELSVIYGWCASTMFGADAGHTPADTGELELDETVASDGSITVSGGAVTVNRLATAANGAIATQKSQIILYGKS